MSPTVVVVTATGGVAVPEIRRGVIEEHDDTSWVSWVLVGEEAPAVVGIWCSSPRSVKGSLVPVLGFHRQAEEDIVPRS